MPFRVDGPRTGAKTYRAATLREAMARVRRDLGGGAVILETRESRRPRLLGFGRREVVEVVAAREAPVSVVPVRSEPGPELRGQVGERLAQLHAMVEELSRHGRVDHLVPDLPSELAPVYARLVEVDVPDIVARRLVRFVGERLEPHEFHRADVVADAVREAVERCVSIAPPIAAVAGARRVVALVGPTGVGKTTTVAKLAANFKLVQGLRPGLVTVDTYRIAAVEQLRTYAEIIDLPLRVANSVGEMRHAVDDLGDVDLVLIDTAGRSPRDEVKIRELAEFLKAAKPDEVHLVLSAAVGERALRSAVDRFEVAAPDRLILTKLDEAEALGGVLAILGRGDRPVSYVTTGQAVPDDIEPAERSRLARLILGRERPS